jgi:hypothetical protein
MKKEWRGASRRECGGMKKIIGTSESPAELFS